MLHYESRDAAVVEVLPAWPNSMCIQLLVSVKLWEIVYLASQCTTNALADRPTD